MIVDFIVDVAWRVWLCILLACAIVAADNIRQISDILESTCEIEKIESLEVYDGS